MDKRGQSRTLDTACVGVGSDAEERVRALAQLLGDKVVEPDVLVGRGRGGRVGVGVEGDVVVMSMLVLMLVRRVRNSVCRRGNAARTRSIQSKL